MFKKACKFTTFFSYTQARADFYAKKSTFCYAKLPNIPVPAVREWE
jgi:hypothetical protein